MSDVHSMGDRFGFRGQPRPNQPGNTQGPETDAWGNAIKKEPQQQQNYPNNKLDPNDPNNTTIDDNTIDNIWEAVKKENSDPAGGGNNQPPFKDQVDPQKQLSDYLTSVGLEPITLSDAEKQEMQSGNFDTVMGKLNNKIAQAHLRAMSGMNQVMTAKIDEAVNRAVEKTTGIVQGQVNLRELHTALPWTKDKAIGPVAQTVMQRFLDRGADTAKAIKGVEAFFTHTSTMVGGNTTVNKNINSNFRSGPSSDEGTESWLDILRPGQ